MFNHLQNENNQTPKSLFTLTQEDVFTSSPIVTQSPIIQNNTLNNLFNIKNIKDYDKMVPVTFLFFSTDIIYG